MSASDFKTFRFLPALALSAFALAALPLSAAASCDAPIPLVPGETWRDPGSAIGEDACFAVDLDAAGTLVLAVAQPSGDPRATLALVDPEDGENAASAVLYRSAAGLVLEGAPGRYLLRVAAEDPRQALASFRLSARVLGEGFAVGTGTKSETDGELEIEPDPLKASCLAAKSETDGELEIEPDPLKALAVKSETDGELEIEPDPLKLLVTADPYDLGGALAVLAPRICTLCAQGETDDHGDDVFCATPLAWGAVVEGEIRNDWSDDADVFRFQVPALGPVEIEAAGDSALTLELVDRHGQRLDVAAGDGGVRRVRTLVPGPYFVRVEARDGGTGRYALSVGGPR